MKLRGYPGLSPANTTEDRARVRSQIIPAAAGWRIVFSIYTNISTIYRMDDGLICSARSCCVLSTLTSGPQNQHRMLPRRGVSCGQEQCHHRRVSPHLCLLCPGVATLPGCRLTTSSSPFLSHSSHIHPWLELQLALVHSPGLQQLEPLLELKL